MGQISESERVAAQGFQAAVDRFGGSVGGVVVEERQHVVAAAVQGAAELGEFFEGLGDAAAQGVDDRDHHGLAASPVGVAVGGDDALVDAPGHLDREVVVVGEHRFQPCLLAAGEQRKAGAQGAPHPVERITGAAAMPARGLLDALADQVKFGAGQRNDVALAGLNHKCGYRGTVNTLLNFGEGKFPVNGEAGAVGYLIGKEGEGLKCMFTLMNEARISVGVGATMLGYAGYEYSLQYAKDRPQGRHMGAGGKDHSSPQVPIIGHTDVKRMLMMQKAIAEGGLALGLLCAQLVDDQHTGSGEEAEKAGLLLELLTPDRQELAQRMGAGSQLAGHPDLGWLRLHA